ncbi:hypothetical protein [Amphiplicatus metriothermophilus]|uniref:Uncharacterized protein n=1 Tax=Amphiplicatus metriothermophilus TaxID=1519374 RepID=A0A239PVD8_9PROT|nr:hypothetical protein [Amphiplicatus metriothermophilus]MBB5519521.1 hypothetical protein [Amphiplicatus metriothermophilus]SNT74088.1 hypothetical protein SAMN06297382_1992 [Amphiplicatus metriothermophilus]
MRARKDRRGRPERIFLALAAGLAAAACAGETVGPAAYSFEQCRRVALIDPHSGAAVRGAEDLAFDPVRGRLFVSAYDRRAAERAARKRAFAIPEGGIYVVPLAALDDPSTDRVVAERLIGPGEAAGGVRPHGIAYDADSRELVFINRAYQRINHIWRLQPRIERVGDDGTVFMGVGREAPCSANDVLIGPEGVLTSFDRAACGLQALPEDLFALRRSGLAGADGARLFEGAAFANGLARARDGALVLAATRERAVLALEKDTGGYALAHRLALPGGPDNLTRAADGGIVAAVHPSLIKLALHRKLGLGAAPSRVVKTDAGLESLEILYDDPKGARFSAATVAIEAQGVLIMGSATDAGLMVCRKAD